MHLEGFRVVSSWAWKWGSPILLQRAQEVYSVSGVSLGLKGPEFFWCEEEGIRELLFWWSGGLWCLLAASLCLLGCFSGCFPVYHLPSILMFRCGTLYAPIVGTKGNVAYSR